MQTVPAPIFLRVNSMGLSHAWNAWRLRRKFAAVGPGCEFRGGHLEIKGRVELGAECVVRGNIVLRTHKAGKIVFGDHVEISDYTLFQINSSLLVGSNTFIGPYVVIRDTNHYFQGTDIHWRLTPHKTDPIVIEDNCFIGAGTYIMPGVTIGHGAVIAPRSIINRSIGANEVWAGAPASMVAHRLDPEKRSKLRRHQEMVAMYGFGDVANDTQNAPA